MRTLNARKVRGGAAVSVALLFAALATQSEMIVSFVGTALLIAVASGFNILSIPFNASGDDVFPAAGVRLGQIIGAGLTALALLVGGPISVVLIGILAALQSLLAVTNICVACRLYGLFRYL